MSSDASGNEYEIVFARSARRELEDLPASIGMRILRRIESLAATPRPRGCRKLMGATDLWRMRTGDYRVIYRIDDAQRIIDIVAIRHRRDAYR